MKITETQLATLKRRVLLDAAEQIMACIGDNNWTMTYRNGIEHAVDHLYGMANPGRELSEHFASKPLPPPPVHSTITDDDRCDHPEPGDPAGPLPDGVQGFALPPRIRVDPDLRVKP